MSNRSLKILIVLLSLSLIWMTMLWSKEKTSLDPLRKELIETRKSLDSLEIVSDSLHVELFPCEVELNRYEIAYKIFLERNPKAASQFGDIISDETE
jgi:hypothetical protein